MFLFQGTYRHLIDKFGIFSSLEIIYWRVKTLRDIECTADNASKTGRIRCVDPKILFGDDFLICKRTGAAPCYGMPCSQHISILEDMNKTNLRATVHFSVYSTDVSRIQTTSASRCNVRIQLTRSDLPFQVLRIPNLFL